jgi:3-dehydroquinate dehydratase/shikimate dehydrogenase
MTYLAVSIMVHDSHSALADAAIAAERGADMVEYRIDTFEADDDALEILVTQSPLPCIVTCRPTWEGGDFEGEETDRLDRLISAARHGAAAVDLESVAIGRAAGLLDHVRSPGQDSDGTRLILSNHDFQSRPSDLQRRVHAMADQSMCSISKIAWRARSIRDNLEAFELLGERSGPMIALCMGEEGLASRVLAKKFGAYLTFASLNAESVTAPGQPTLEQMKQLFRWDQLNADTKVYGVIGWPVGHSLSPDVFNAGFDATGYDGVYLPMPILDAYEAFKATVGSWLDFAPLHFGGASVTIPHKQNLIRFVAESGGEIEPVTQRIGAANTLTVREDGSLAATNTDYAAALSAVCEVMGCDLAGLAGKRVAMLGAGGVVRAMAAGFSHYGADVVLHNRTAARAEALAADLNDGSGGSVTTAPPDALTSDAYDIYINGTPLGMHPNTDQTPMETWPTQVTEGAIAFDTIYNPLKTKWLADADAAGCQTIPGIAMFVRQALAQFKLWTGQDASADLFEQVVRKKLG